MAIVTTAEYWDCECNDEYMHSKLEDSCTRCGATREDSPDSHVNEVIAAGLPFVLSDILSNIVL